MLILCNAVYFFFYLRPCRDSLYNVHMPRPCSYTFLFTDLTSSLKYHCRVCTCTDNEFTYHIHLYILLSVDSFWLRESNSLHICGGRMCFCTRLNSVRLYIPWSCMRFYTCPCRGSLKHICTCPIFGRVPGERLGYLSSEPRAAPGSSSEHPRNEQWILPHTRPLAEVQGEGCKLIHVVIIVELSLLS
jgi:hypothetical protein